MTTLFIILFGWLALSFLALPFLGKLAATEDAHDVEENVSSEEFAVGAAVEDGALS